MIIEIWIKENMKMTCLFSNDKLNTLAVQMNWPINLLNTQQTIYIASYSVYNLNNMALSGMGELIK